MMERSARTKLIAAAVLGAVFGSGLLVGFAADSHFADEAPVVVAQRDSAPSRTSDGERPRRPLVYEQLNPTPEQTAVIDSILRVHRERMNKLDREYREARHEYRTSYDVVVQETREAIAAVFPPEVATEYRRLLAEFDARRAAERAASGPDDRD